ncbi:uncharacterized protein LOC144100098 [Amblyomma americanum]
MANTGAYPHPSCVALPNTLGYGYDPAQEAAYGPVRQVAYGQVPYTPGTFTPDLIASQTQPESYMSIWKDDMDKPGLFKMVMIAALFILLLMAVMATVVMLLNVPSAYPTESTKDDFGGVGSPGVSVYIVPETPRKSSTATPPKSTTGGSTAPPTRSPRQALNERPMVCTIGSKLSSGAMLPDDGLCDYIFYDSIYKNRRNLLLDPNNFGNDLRIFLDSYNTYRTTAFGIAFAFKSTRHLKHNLRVGSRSPLAYFWDREIFHFGILDTPTSNLKGTEVDAAMDCLRDIDSQAETQRNAGHPSFIFFAVVLLNYTLEDRYDRNFKNLYQPDVVITQGHYYYGDNTFAECRVLPPTVVTRPQDANNTYRHDLTAAVDSIRKLSRLTRRDKRVFWAVSVTMKGHYTEPLPGRPLQFLERCAHNPSGTSFGSYADICRDPNFERHFTYSADQGAMLAHHDTARLVMSYDNEAGFCKKLCRIQGEQPNQRFGIAAFDLDYDDFFNTCASMNKYGKFSRLRALRRIVEFFRTSFRADTDEPACLQLVT